MILVVLMACFRLDAPFHSQEETGLPPLPEVDDPPDTDCAPDCDAPESAVANTHYVMIGGEGASNIEFQDSAEWLQPLSSFSQAWSISVRLPTGMPDPSGMPGPRRRPSFSSICRTLSAIPAPTTT